MKQSITRYTQSNNLGYRGSGAYYRKLNIPAPDIANKKRPVVVGTTRLYRKSGVWYCMNFDAEVWHPIKTQSISDYYDRVIANEVWLPMDHLQDVQTEVDLMIGE